MRFVANYNVSETRKVHSFKDLLLMRTLGNVFADFITCAEYTYLYLHTQF